MSATTIAPYGRNGQKDVCFSRMLKKSASGVLASFRSSTYPRGYASGLHSLRPCWTAFLSILQGCSALGLACKQSNFCFTEWFFPQPARLCDFDSRFVERTTPDRRLG